MGRAQHRTWAAAGFLAFGLASMDCRGRQDAPAAPASSNADTTESDPRFDADTGRDVANYPPSSEFDFLHMRLVMEFPNLDVPMFSAVETLSATALGVSRGTLRLDAGAEIEVDSVASAGRVVRTRRDANGLWVDFDSPVKPGEEVQLVIRYTANFRGSRGVGLTWSPAKPDGKGPTEQNVQLHSQGEAEENRRWFLAHDFPNEKMTTELIVTVQDGPEVCSNGHLVSKERASASRVMGPTPFFDGSPVRPKLGAAFTTWHWLQDKPHPSYLVTLVVGTLAVIDINPAGASSARPGLPMRVLTPFGTEGAAEKAFANTPAMVRFFEKRFNQPYPWDKYDQLVCRDFRWGGMENTSATTLTLSTPRGERGAQDDLISHELAHQWFGDLVTCKSWEHLWLNEGWASICEALWNEQKANAEALGTDGAFAEIAPPTDAGRKAYQRTVMGFMRGQRGGNRAYAPQYPAMVSRYYRRADDVVGKADDVYSKGALVLHMLRVGLGDENFFRGTALYLDRLKFKSAETDEFRECLEQVSGRSLERFFDQWAYRPGLPRLEVDLDLSSDQKTLNVAVEQSQRIDAYNPAYTFTLPLLLKYEDGSFKYVYVDVNSKSATASFPVSGKPSQVSVDPNLTIAAASTVRKPLAWWRDELRDGPTFAARAEAARALARSDDSAAFDALAMVESEAAGDADLRDLVREERGAVAARPGR